MLGWRLVALPREERGIRRRHPGPAWAGRPWSSRTARIVSASSAVSIIALGPGPASGSVPALGLCDQPARPDGPHHRLVVALGLVGIGDGEGRHGAVERSAPAQVAADQRRV